MKICRDCYWHLPDPASQTQHWAWDLCAHPRLRRKPGTNPVTGGLWYDGFSNPKPQCISINHQGECEFYELDRLGVIS